MADEDLEHLLKIERARPAVDQRQHDQAVSLLQRRELVELVQHQVGIGLAF